MRAGSITDLLKNQPQIDESHNNCDPLHTGSGQSNLDLGPGGEQAESGSRVTNLIKVYYKKDTLQKNRACVNFVIDPNQSIPT